MSRINRENYPIYFVDFYDRKLSQQEIAELKAFLKKNPDLQEEFEVFPKLSVSATNDISSPDFSYLKKDISSLELTTENADELIISLLEGDYPSEMQPKLQKWIESNPHVKAECEKLLKAKLTPEKIVCEKASLYRLPDFKNEPVNADNAPWFAIALMEGDLSMEEKHKFHQWLQQNPRFDYDFLNTKLIPDSSITYGNKVRLKHFKVAAFRVASYSLAAAMVAFLIGLFNFISQNPTPSAEDRVQLTVTEESNTTTQVAQSISVTHIKEAIPLNQIKRPNHISYQKISPIQIIKPYLDSLYNTSDFELVRQQKPVDFSYALVLDPEDDIELQPNETETAPTDVKLLQRVGAFVTNYAQKTFGKTALKQSLKIETRRNENKEIIYFSIETPVFAIERKK